VSATSTAPSTAPGTAPATTRATVVRVGIVVVVVAALVLVELTSRSGVLWRLTTFTYQAGVAAAAFHTWALLSRRAAARTGLRGAVTLYVLVAGVVWNLFLVEQSMGYTVANVLLHVVLPVLVLAEWTVVDDDRGDLRWWHPLAWLAYPVVYLGLALLVLNEAGRRAPYRFLDPDAVGAGTVAGNVALLAVGFVALGYVLAAIGRLALAARRRSGLAGERGARQEL